MTSKDVRDILSLPMDGPGPSTSALAAAAASSSKRRSGGGHGPKRERPEGISRELFALIGDHGVSLAEAQAMVGQEKRGKGAVTAGYKERVGAGRRNVKWCGSGWILSRGHNIMLTRCGTIVGGGHRSRPRTTRADPTACVSRTGSPRTTRPRARIRLARLAPRAPDPM